MFRYTFYYKTSFLSVTATSSAEALRRLREETSAQASRTAMLVKVEREAS